MHLCVNIVTVTGFGQIVIRWWPNQPEIIGNQWDCVKNARKFVTVQEDLMTEENEIILSEKCDRGGALENEYGLSNLFKTVPQNGTIAI